MKLIVIGDSISVGTYTAPTDPAPNSVVAKNYGSYLQDYFGADAFINYSINGVSYSETSTVYGEQSVTNRCAAFEKGDYIFLSCGTNDYGTNVKLGERTDKTDISFYGAVDIVFRQMKKENPKSAIYVMLPIPRDNEGRNEAGFCLNDYRNVLKKKASEYGFRLIDGSRLAIDPKDAGHKERYILDGVHINEEGHKMLAELMIKEIKAMEKRKAGHYDFTINGYQGTVIIPENANGEWIWKTEFFYAFDQAEQDLLAKGYTRAYYGISDKYGSEKAVRLMRDFHSYVVETFGLADKSNLAGFSRGGLYAFNYALYYPERVKKIYFDAPVFDLKSWPLPESTEQKQLFEEFNLSKETFAYFKNSPVDNLEEFSKNNIPVLLIAGCKDTLVPFSENGEIMLNYYKQNGIPITYYLKDECNHHPHSLKDTTPILEFISNE